jgi:hypothetical protein
MSTKRRGLGKGVDALFSAEEKVSSEGAEEPDVSSSKVKDKTSKLEVIRPQSEVVGSQLEGLSSKLEVGRSVLEGVSYNQEAMKIAIREADKNPRITMWSPVSTAMLKYLRKTIPEFSISEEASILLEDAITRKYPDLYEGLKKEKDRSRL